MFPSRLLRRQSRTSCSSCSASCQACRITTTSATLSWRRRTSSPSKWTSPAPWSTTAASRSPPTLETRRTKRRRRAEEERKEEAAQVDKRRTALRNWSMMNEWMCVCVCVSSFLWRWGSPVWNNSSLPAFNVNALTMQWSLQRWMTVRMDDTLVTMVRNYWNCCYDAVFCFVGSVPFLGYSQNQQLCHYFTVGKFHCHPLLKKKSHTSCLLIWLSSTHKVITKRVWDRSLTESNFILIQMCWRGFNVAESVVCIRCVPSSLLMKCLAVWIPHLLCHIFIFILFCYFSLLQTCINLDRFF